MIRRTAQGVLPHPCEHIFTVIADVERYPEFVPGWREVRVLERGERRVRVEQAFALGPMQWRFESEARFDPPRGIDIEAGSGPFESLLVRWRFERVGPDACRVALEVRATLHSPALEALYGALLDRQTSGLWDVFARRIATLHAA